MRYLTTGILLAATLAIVAVYPVQTVQPGGRTEIAQPPEWVAFDADLRRTAPGSREVTLGRYYRNVDGSDRRESRLGDISVVHIRNVERSLSYVKSPLHGWISQPMVLPRGAWSPPRYYREHPSLSPVAEPIEGFTVFRWVNGAGDESLMAPDLNFFRLRERSHDGTEVIYSNVVVRPQPPDLFEPPSGVPVRHVTTPGGIVASEPQAADSKGGRSCKTCPTPSIPSR